MCGFGLEIEGESSSCCSHGDILSAKIVGWLNECLLSLGHLNLSIFPQRRYLWTLDVKQTDSSADLRISQTNGETC
jgi:hypothetical protein